MDLSQHKLTAFAELDLFQNDRKAFEQYFLKTLTMLINLEKGQEFDVIKSVTEENYPLFIKCTCFCFHVVNGLEFNNEYTKIRRMT